MSEIKIGEKRKRDPSTYDDELESLRKKILTEEEYQKRLVKTRKGIKDRLEENVKSEILKITKKCIKIQKELCENGMTVCEIYGIFDDKIKPTWNTAEKALKRIINNFFKEELKEFEFRIYERGTPKYRIYFHRRSDKKNDDDYKVIRSK